MFDCKKLAGNWIFWALIISLFGRLLVSYPLNSNMLDGTDSTVYMHRIWFAATNNQIDWDSSWYGGYPSLKYYAPVNYLFGSFFALFANPVIAYKIVIDFFFLIAPITFYLFAKEFLNKNNLAVSIMLFSFFPINMYYFWNGNYVAIVNLPIVLLFWREFKLYLDANAKKHFRFSALFCGISLLTHQLTAVFGIYLIFLWSLFAYRRIVLKPILIGFLISSFWFVPFILNYGGGNILKVPEVSSFVSNAVFHLGAIKFLAMVILFVITAAYAISFKDREANSFLFMLFLIGIVLTFTLYNRILIFLSIPTAIIIAKIYSKSKPTNLFVVVVLFVFVFSFYTFRPLTFIEGHKTWELPNAESRVIYYPAGKFFCMSDECARGIKVMYISYLAPVSGQEIINGWFPQSQIVPQLKGRKMPYLEKIEKFLIFNLSDKELYSLLKEGYVNSVVVNKNYTEYMNFFSNSGLFVLDNETDDFAVFKLKQKSSYIEIDNLPVDYTLERNGKEIKARFKCRKGVLKIKEGYDNFWEAYLNKEKIGLKLNNYGFMESTIDGEGECELKLIYKNKYAMFSVLSILALALLF